MGSVTALHTFCAALGYAGLAVVMGVVVAVVITLLKGRHVILVDESGRGFCKSLASVNYRHDKERG